MKSFISTLVLLGVAGMSEATLLDSFDVPYSRSISTGTYVDTMADPSFFGGHRDIGIEIYRNTGSGSVHVEIANGRLRITNEPGVIAIVRLQYDGTGEAAQNLGAGRHLVPYVLPGDRPFGEGTDSMNVYIDDAQYTRGISVGLNLYKNGALENQISRNPPRGQSIVAVGNPVIFAINNAIEAEFQLFDGGDSITVDRMELVPEPASGFAILGAVGTLAAMRLKRNT